MLGIDPFVSNETGDMVYVSKALTDHLKSKMASSRLFNDIHDTLTHFSGKRKTGNDKERSNPDDVRPVFLTVSIFQAD